MTEDASLSNDRYGLPNKLQCSGCIVHEMANTTLSVDVYQRVISAGHDTGHYTYLWSRDDFGQWLSLGGLTTHERRAPSHLYVPPAVTQFGLGRNHLQGVEGCTVVRSSGTCKGPCQTHSRMFATWHDQLGCHEHNNVINIGIVFFVD